MKYLIISLLLIFSVQNITAQDRLQRITQELENLIEKKDWQKAKRRINEFYDALPADLTELNIVEQYEVGKIERRVNVAIQQEENSYRNVLQKRTVSACTYYLNEYPYGKYRNEVIRLKNEIEQKAREERELQARQKERNMYEKAVNEDGTYYCQQYLNAYPSGTYTSEVRSLMNKRTEEEYYRKARSSNIITDYENYIQKYPHGKYAAEVNIIIENSYYKFGNEAYDAKKWYNAKSYYETYLDRYPRGRYASEAKKKINELDRKMNQRGKSFVMYTYDQESPIGISFGNLKTTSAGYYLNIKCNPHLFTYNLWTIDNNGESDSPWDLDPTGETRSGNLVVSGGLTFKVAYPLWAYIGGGIGYYPFFEEIDEYDTSGDLYETVWMRNTDKTSFNLSPEAGLKFKVGDFMVLKYGIRIRDGVIHQFGLGF